MPGHHAHPHTNSHPHGHGHGHGGDVDWEEYADQLERQGEVSVGVVRGAVAWLRPRLPATVTRVLDVGSGPGVASAVLAEAFPEAEVVAVDGTAHLLERARARGGGRVTTRLAELPGDIDSLPDADLVWASRVVHHVGDQQAALTALARRLRPGGLLAISEGGLPHRFLPRDIGIGRPGLQARMDAAQEEWFAAMRAGLPDATATVEDWPALLTRAGLTEPATRSFLTEQRPPLAAATREMLHGHLSRFRDTLADALDAEDRATLEKLLDPDAPTGIRHRPDAFYLAVTTVHAARAA